ncbi:MAG: DUF1972 domain-containing protein [Kangiellaceae bacterium]|nr:DUF1972 domain-containing protein [Kangiellaceae bacterium]
MKKENKKVAIIGTVGVPACYGGFETLVENLITDSPIDMVVYCSSKTYKKKIRNYKGAALHYIPLSANGAQSVLYDLLSIFHAVFKGYRTLLVLGVSGALCLPIVKLLFPKVKIITNIDGLEWRRDKWGGIARKFLKFSEKIAVKYSTSVVSDNQAIADYVHKEYSLDSTVIAYGGDHCVIKPLPNKKNNYFFALCRIEPENNVHLILKAFENSSEKIVFVGNWDNSSYGRALKLKYSESENILLLDPIYDLNKLFELRSECKAYIHGHSAGGTNPSLVEMMFFNKLIIAFDCNYNKATMEDKGMYFACSESLNGILKSNIENFDGYDLKEIAERRYMWSVVKSQYYNLF